MKLYFLDFKLANKLQICRIEGVACSVVSLHCNLLADINYVLSSVFAVSF